MQTIKNGHWNFWANVFAILAVASCTGDAGLTDCAAGKCDGPDYQAPHPYSVDSTLPVFVFMTHADGADYAGIQERGKEVRTDFLLEILDNDEGEFEGQGESGGDLLKGGLRIRGNSSAMNLKNSLDLKFEEKMKIPGVGKARRWVLYAPYIDKTMMRNVMGYELARKMGLVAPITRFVEVYVNAEYLGIYVLSPKIHNDMDCNEYQTDEGGCMPDYRDDGVMVKRDGEPDEDDVSFDTPVSQIPLLIKEPDIETDEDKARIEAIFAELEEALCSDDFASRYPELIDVDSFVNFFLLRELYGDFDGFRRSMTFYLNTEGKLVVGPVWDLDGSSGGIRLTVAAHYTTIMDRAIDWLFLPWHEPDHDWMMKFKLPPLEWLKEKIGLDSLPAGLREGIIKLDRERPLPWMMRMMQDPIFIKKVQERWPYVRDQLLGFSQVQLPADTCDGPIPETPFWNSVLGHVTPLTEGCSIDGNVGPMSLDKKLTSIDGDCSMRRNFLQWDNLGKESARIGSRDSGTGFWDEAPQWDYRPDGERCRGVLRIGLFRLYRKNYADILADWHYWMWMRAEWIDNNIGQLDQVFPVENACILEP